MLLYGYVFVHIDALASRLLRHVVGLASLLQNHPQTGVRLLRGFMYSSGAPPRDDAPHVVCTLLDCAFAHT